MKQNVKKVIFIINQFGQNSNLKVIYNFLKNDLTFKKMMLYYLLLKDKGVRK